MQILNSMDASHRRVAFVGFSESANAAARLQTIEGSVKQHVGANSFSTGNFYKGPANDQVLSPAGYAEFPSSKGAKDFILR
eukprot:7528224-Pyramimonas_sp.AAC.1